MRESQPTVPPIQPIRTDGSNLFCHQTFTTRLPRIVREVQRANPQLHPTMHAALDDLHDALIQNAPLAPLNLPAPDADLWAEQFLGHEADTWLNTEWYFAEHYFFRLILQATRFFDTGIDPYLPVKLREIESAGFQKLLATVLSAPRDLHYLMEQVLWGNRIDLSHPSGLQSAQDIASDDLLADDRAAAIAHLEHAAGSLHLIADNFGSELMMDLLLIDHLLTLGKAVVLHLKMHPTYVSDATVPDVQLLIGRLAQGSHDAHTQQASQLGQRLQQALAAGQMRLAPDFYWNSPRWLSDLPPRLETLFMSAGLVILKGDANYRKAIYDMLYPPETPFAQVTAYFPAPLLAFRTLKSDPVLGLPAGKAAALDQQHQANWRVMGRYGVIQFKPPQD